MEDFGVDMISLAILLKTLGIELNIILLNKGTSLFKDAGRILTAKTTDAHNTFDNPNVVAPAVFKNAKVTKKGLSVTVPAKAIISLELL
jgi:alpha-N-arabinofuranosidase